jgi:hypothetical protein
MFRAYAAGVLCLRQSGTFLFYCVRFSVLRAENRTQKMFMYHAAVCPELSKGRRLYSFETQNSPTMAENQTQGID